MEKLGQKLLFGKKICKATLIIDPSIIIVYYY